MPIVYYLFAAALVGGGAMGTVMSKEPWSILGSSAFAIVAVAAGLLTRSGKPNGLLIGLVDGVALAVFFLYRFLNGAKPMVAFPSIAMGLIVAGLSVAAMNRAKAASGR